MAAKVSVIIPCYNSGAFLEDAVNSVDAYQGSRQYEIYIVNDGSTDFNTLAVLDKLQRNPRVTIITQENKGPAAARNTGIASSNGEFLLLLDSDNRVLPPFIDDAASVLESEPSVGVVYGNPVFIGENSANRFWPSEYSGEKMLMGNYIDMCTMIRRKAWQEIGPFDESRVIFGHEDWEYWIRAGKSDWKFRYIRKPLFEYRLRSDSLLMQKSETDNIEKVQRYIYLKHLDYLLSRYAYLLNESIFYHRDKRRPLRTFVKNLYHACLRNKYVRR